MASNAIPKALAYLYISNKSHHVIIHGYRGGSRQNPGVFD